MIEVFRDWIIPIFNIVFGSILLLTGLNILKPFKAEKEYIYEKYKNFIKIMGIGMILWGLINLFIFD